MPRRPSEETKQITTIVFVIHRIKFREDINRTLVSWKVPQNEFMCKQEVMLYRILSYTAGLTNNNLNDSVFGAALRGLLHSLDGVNPANLSQV